MQLGSTILSFIRRAVGQKQTTQQLRLQLQHQQEQQLQHQQQLLALGNGLKYLNTNPESITATTTYKRCAQMISLLSPMDVEAAKYLRVGKDFDGGYVMIDDFEADSVDAAYSFGIADDVSWDEEIAGRGIDVFMYDHTIDKLPRQHPRFHYFKQGITGKKKGEDLRTLQEILEYNGHAQRTNLIMKMDIEGCEWDVFQHVEPGNIDQFSQIVIEIHGLVAAVYDPKALATVMGVLRKINETHQSVHVHANSSGIPLWVGGLVIADVMEVTYLRRVDQKNKFVPSSRQFPTELDQPTFQGGHDVYLGKFACDGQMINPVEL